MIIVPKPTGLRSGNCFLAFPVIVFSESYGGGSLGREGRFHHLRFDGWAFDTVAGKRFRDELNQTFHRGLLVPQSSWPVRLARPLRHFPFDESPEGMPGLPKPG